MTDITAALKRTVSISLFNRGFAGKIFEEVKKNGAKVVMKNNSPECVLLSPEEYIKLMEDKRCTSSCRSHGTNAEFQS